MVNCFWVDYSSCGLIMPHMQAHLILLHAESVWICQGLLIQPQYHFNKLFGLQGQFIFFCMVQSLS